MREIESKERESERESERERDRERLYNKTWSPTRIYRIIIHPLLTVIPLLNGISYDVNMLGFLPKGFHMCCTR